MESVKAASDIYGPVAGEVVEANEAVTASPETINGDAYANWLFRLRPTRPGDIDKLLDASGYTKAITG